MFISIPKHVVHSAALSFALFTSTFSPQVAQAQETRQIEGASSHKPMLERVRVLHSELDQIAERGAAINDETASLRQTLRTLPSHSSQAQQIRHRIDQLDYTVRRMRIEYRKVDSFLTHLEHVLEDPRLSNPDARRAYMAAAQKTLDHMPRQVRQDNPRLFSILDAGLAIAQALDGAQR